MIDEEGSNISAGEKQLITIARAFLADPAILILDEATSSVDTRTEVLVQRAMAALRSDRTSFVIAHRLSTIRDADVILVMEQGSIVEQGTHHELLDARGHYWELYNSQFSAAIEEPEDAAEPVAVGAPVRQRQSAHLTALTVGKLQLGRPHRPRNRETVNRCRDLGAMGHPKQQYANSSA